MVAEVSKQLERLRDPFHELAELRDRLREAGVTWPRPLPEAAAGTVRVKTGPPAMLRRGGPHRRDAARRREDQDIRRGAGGSRRSHHGGRAAPPEELERVLLCRVAREDRLRVAAASRGGREACVAEAVAVPPGYKRGGDCELTIRKADSCGEGEICRRPLRLYMGLGLASAAALEEAVEAVEKTLRELGVDASAAVALASVKPAAAEVARWLGVPAVVYKPEELKLDWDRLSPPSPKALEALGVPGAAEPAALTAAGPGAFLLYRRRVFGRVTVAVAAAP